jgi:hypothetical protein
MQLSFKFLAWVLLLSIFSAVGVGSNRGLIDGALSETILYKYFFSSRELSDKSLNDIAEINQFDREQAADMPSLVGQIFLNSHSPDKQPYIDSVSGKTFFIPNLIWFPEDSRPHTSLSDMISGVDGTGGPQPIPSAGIDGTGGPQPIPSTGIDGTGGPGELPKEPPIIAKIASSGALQKSGNRFVVSGTKFQVNDSTSIIIDGQINSDVSMLSSGQVATVKVGVDGDNNSIATEIIVATQISGEISNIADNSITVLQQTILLHDDIVFGGSAKQFSDLRRRDMVKVSGFKMSDGYFSAIRIDRVDSGIDKITGSISQVNDSEKTFFINDLAVSYSQVAAPFEPKEGVVVNVQGIVDDQNLSVLDAGLINVTPSILNNANVDKIEVEGFITEFIDTDNFRVGDIVVLFDDYGTDFIGGEYDDLELNKKVEVEGELDIDVEGNRVLRATKVIFLVANITSHTANNYGKMFATSSTETFRWSDVNADAYRLRIYQNSNSNGVFYDKTFDGDVTSVTVSGLPDNSAYFVVDLYTLQGEFWSRRINYFYGPGTVASSELTSHENGVQLNAKTETFIFSPIEGAEKYRLRFFHFATNEEYYDQTFTEAGTVVVSGLPSNGVNMSVRLSTLYNGWWSEQAYNLTSVHFSNEQNATLSSHTNGQRLSNTTETFIWDDVGAEEYELRVLKLMYKKGSNSAWHETVSKEIFDGSVTSSTIENLPENSGEVLVRLFTKHSGWAEERYTFLGVDTAASAELTSHSNKEVLSSSTQTFKWHSVPDAEAYLLSVDGFNVKSFNNFSEDYEQPLKPQEPLEFKSSEMKAEVKGLPTNGARFKLTLSTKHNGYWEKKVYRLKGVKESSSANAVITSHVSRQKVTTSSTTVTWENTDADAYFLSVINLSVSPYVKLYDQLHGAGINSVIIGDLPKGSDIRINLCTKHGDWWACDEDGASVDFVTEIP